MAPLIITTCGISNSFDLMPVLQPSRLSMHQINWKFRNQRQIRKNRRRANAAGARKPFA
jgi:hypothetical protein